MKRSTKSVKISGSTAKRVARTRKAVTKNRVVRGIRAEQMANYVKAMSYLMKTEDDQLDLMISSARK